MDGNHTRHARFCQRCRQVLVRSCARKLDYAANSSPRIANHSPFPSARTVAGPCLVVVDRSKRVRGYSHSGPGFRLDFVIYGATPLGEAPSVALPPSGLLLSLTRTRQPQPCAAAPSAVRVAVRSARVARRSSVLGAEIGGRWSEGSLRLLHELVRFPERSFTQRAFSMLVIS